jgi:hypothetical protein
MPQVSARFIEFLDQTALPADSIRAAAALGITALKVALAEQPGVATDLAGVCRRRPCALLAP